jgi:predicted acetyltransferase
MVTHHLSLWSHITGHDGHTTLITMVMPSTSTFKYMLYEWFQECCLLSFCVYKSHPYKSLRFLNHYITLENIDADIPLHSAIGTRIH